MPSVSIRGPYQDDSGNVVFGHPKISKNARVEFRAKNCRLDIGPGVKLENLQIQFECDNSICCIGANSNIKGIIQLGLDSKVIIGKNLWAGGCRISAAEHTSVVVGDGCMFAVGVEVRSDDSHPIFDARTGKRLNPSKGISVADHVWLATQVVVLGGARVGKSSVVGYRSVVTSSIPEHCVAAGIPAKVVRTGIVWERKHVILTAPYDFPMASDATKKLREAFIQTAPASPSPDDRNRARERARSSVRLLRKLITKPRVFLRDSRNAQLRKLSNLCLPQSS